MASGLVFSQYYLIPLITSGISYVAKYGGVALHSPTTTMLSKQKVSGRESKYLLIRNVNIKKFISLSCQYNLKQTLL